MTREASAASLLSEGLARIADAGGVVLLVALGWRMFFVFDPSLQTCALTVGVIGSLACWADRRALKNAPAFMLAYAGIALLSAAVHRWAGVSAAAEPEWSSLFTPALHLVVMVAFVYGTAHLLRTPGRLSLFTLLLLASIGVLAVQILFDRASAGFVYVRGGTLSLPSVPHWGGIHGTSLFLTLGLPLALAVSVVGRTGWRILAGIVLGGGLLLVAYFNGSRGGLIAMAMVSMAMGTFMAVTRARSKWRVLTLAVVVLAVPIALTVALLSNRTSSRDVTDLGGRGLMWEIAGGLALDNVWLGVGPGNYSHAVSESGYDQDYLKRYLGLHNAHSLPLHVGAEVGVVGLLCLIAFLGWTLRSCWRAWARGQVPQVSLGLLFALVGFLVHSLSENFLDARAEVERTRLIVWMIFAAALALERLSSAGTAGRP